MLDLMATQNRENLLASRSDGDFCGEAGSIAV